MQQKSFIVNWRAMQLLIVMFLLLVYAAIDVSTGKRHSRARAEVNKTGSSENAQKGVLVQLSASNDGAN
jgi:hypothetical protein